MSGDGIVMMNGASGVPERAASRAARGKPWDGMDLRFLIVILLSLLLHGLGAGWLHFVKVEKQEVVVLEKMPERFAKLIIEKPIPKEQPAPPQTAGTTGKAKPAEATEKKSTASPTSSGMVSAAEAKSRVAARTARVEKKIRTVGVLGMLTGAGKTAKGPAVVDVLAGAARTKERNTDLDAALAKMSGLTKAENVDVLSHKLVKSKDVEISNTETIDDLMAGIGGPEPLNIEKRGNFVVQRPQSVEGAGSTSAKRDNNAISKVVSSHKTSIRMSYEKYLKRDPRLSGKVTIRFTISAEGRVIKVQVLENTTGNDNLAGDISRKIRMWRFEPVPEGVCTVTYPFVFQPA